MDYLECKTFTIKALSPVIIKGGSAIEDYGTGYLKKNIDDNFVYIVDAQKLQSEIYKTGEKKKEGGGLEFVEKFIDIFVKNSIDNKSNNKSKNAKKTLDEFLNDIGFDYRNKINEISKGIVYTHHNSKYNKINFIKSGQNNYFIPGSSVKGAMRTAILYKMIKNDPEGKNFIENIFKQNLSKFINAGGKAEKEKIKKSFSNKIFEHYIQKNAPLDSNQSRNNEDDLSYFDFLRALKVSDSLSININHNKSIKILSANNSIKWKNIKNKDIIINCEFFFSDTSITISLDYNILNSYKRNDIPFKSIDELLEICSEFSLEQWEYEKKFFENISKYNTINLDKIISFYNDEHNKPTLRIGYGTGLLGTTIDLLLEVNSRNKIRNDIYGTSRDIDVPKSRRLVVKNDIPENPLGWISLQETNSKSTENIDNDKNENKIKVFQSESPILNNKNWIKAEIIDTKQKPPIIKIIEGEHKDKETKLPSVQLENLNLGVGSKVLVELSFDKKKKIEKADYKGKVEE